MDYRPERDALEQLLTTQVRKNEPRASAVTVSFDCKFAIYSVGDVYQLRKLSPAAQKFLREGGSISDDLLE